LIDTWTNRVLRSCVRSFHFSFDFFPFFPFSY